METIFEDIAHIVKYFGAIETSVLRVYLVRAYDLSKNMASMKIHKAVVQRLCKEMKDEAGNVFIVSPFTNSISSRDARMSRAIRVALEFMNKNDTNFFHESVVICMNATALLQVRMPPSDAALAENRRAQAKIIEISYVLPNNEFFFAQMLAEKPVSIEFRPFIKRVACVEPGYNVDMLQNIGFTMFVQFGRGRFTFTRDDIHVTQETDRWSKVKDVPATRNG